MKLSDELLIESARRWSNIYDLALRQLSMAMSDPYRDDEIILALNHAAAGAQMIAAQRLSELASRGLKSVADNIRETRGQAEEPTVPFALRLAEAPLDVEEVACG